MLWNIFMVVGVAAASLVTAIKVPIENLENIAKESTKVDQNPIQYISDESLTQGYLLPPIPYKSEEIVNEVVKPPATFLLPPSGATMIDYYRPSEPEQQQQDWYPIAPEPHQNAIHGQLIPKKLELPNIMIGNIRSGKILQNSDNVLPPVPATVLLPPAENAPNYYLVDAPLTEPRPVEQGLQSNYKKPTGLYPKKVLGSFSPVPIPIAQFAENSAEIPKAKPIRPFRPQPTIEGIHFTPSDEKKIFLYKQLEEKRNLKKENDQVDKKVADKYKEEDTDDSSPIEESSENIHKPKHDSHPASANQVTSKRPVYVPANKGERTEFRMHGMNGPHSYQFGFDTGKGKNRQFRYEERDNDGHVRGHYGYVDKLGKLRVVNYDADPKLGFRADPPVVQE